MSIFLHLLVEITESIFYHVLLKNIYPIKYFLFSICLFKKTYYLCTRFKGTTTCSSKAKW